MQKITHVNFAKGFRGGERQTLLLIEELAKKGYQQTLLTRKKSLLASRAEGIENLLIIRLAKPYALHLHHVKYATLLHAHETKAAQFAYLAYFLFKIPYIITRRVDIGITKNFFNTNIYQKSATTVVLSKAIKREINKVASDINMEIIPDAYSQLFIDPAGMMQIKERFYGKFLLGHIGELDNAHKGQHYLIEAMKKLAYSHPHIHLILLGKGKDEMVFKTQAEGLSNITFEGFVDNVGDYIQCFDLFVFPSLREGLGSILLDVMQADVPIVATDTGGIPDVIHDRENGLLVPIKNRDALYEAIQKLEADSSLRIELAKQAQKDIDIYAPSKMADSYIQLYKKIIL